MKQGFSSLLIFIDLNFIRTHLYQFTQRTLNTYSYYVRESELSVRHTLQQHHRLNSGTADGGARAQVDEIDFGLAC